MKNLKKAIIMHIPYFFIGLFATKLGQMWRFTSGAELGEKILNLGEGFFLALESPMPSFHPFDLCVGIVVAGIFRLIVYGKSKNVKKYRRNEEYGFSSLCPTPTTVSTSSFPCATHSFSTSFVKKRTMCTAADSPSMYAV